MSINLYVLIFALVLFTVHCFVSVEFYRTAVMKGWSDKKYLLMAVFLWLIGYLLIIALPDRGGYNRKAVESNDLPDI